MWIGWGIGTGNRSHFLAENRKHAREAGSPPPYLVLTLLLNTAARPDSALNPVEHRWILEIPVERDYGLQPFVQVVTIDMGRGESHLPGQKKGGAVKLPNKN